MSKLSIYAKEFLNRVRKELEKVPTPVDDIYIKLFSENFLTKMEVLKVFKENSIDPSEDSIKREVCSAVWTEYGSKVAGGKCELVSFMMVESFIADFKLDMTDFVKFAMEMDYTVFEKRSPLGKVTDYLIATLYNSGTLEKCIYVLNRERGLKLDINDFTEIDHLP